MTRHPEPQSLSALLSVLTISMLVVVSCGPRQLIRTPNLYLDTGENPFASVPETFQNNKVDVFYVTDRSQILNQEGKDTSLRYGHGRSSSLAYGSATVEIGENISWDDLVAASRTDDRKISLPMSVGKIVENGRFPATPGPVVWNDSGGASLTSEFVRRSEEAASKFQDEVRKRLARTRKKEIYFYVHGYNNSFDKAVSVIAELWHFLGREGVPLAYTWPAGVGGLRGYFYDRESGEFTIYHLKQILRTLLACDEIEGVHFIAHSRGTDVLISALRELYLELRQKVDDKEIAFKVRNIVLAAPDLDIEVMAQRVVAERFMSFADRLTIYMSTDDLALGLSTTLFLSQRRVGRVNFSELPVEFQKFAVSAKRVNLIDANVKSGFVGHSYFYSHPAVLSDLILLLRDHLGPGKANGRPLEKIDVISWRINENYPEPVMKDD